MTLKSKSKSQFNFNVLSLFMLFSNLIHSNSFVLNNQINTYKRIYDNKVVKVYEPNFIDKSNMNALLFYSGANSLIPGEIYSNFIKALNYYNYSVIIATNDNSVTKELLYSITNEYNCVVPITHSSGYVNCIKTIYNQEKIKKAVFLDPVDNSALVDFKLPSLSFDFGKMKIEDELTFLENVLILNAEKSYKWKLFPKPEIPFIPNIGLNINNFKSKYPNVNVEKLSAEDYGHSDILDSLWSDLMHATISKGNENRDQQNLDEYHLWLAGKINNFIIEEEEIIESIKDVEVLTNETGFIKLME